MLRAVVISVFCISYALSMTTTMKPHHVTHAPRPSQEPAEHEFFKFFYEPHAHMMLVVVSKKCYVFALSDAEKAGVHTDAGMRAVELKLLSSLNTVPVTEVTKDQLHVRVAHACGHVDHYYTETTV